jgi:inner membrane protein
MDSLTPVVLGGAIRELVAGRKMGNRIVLWGAIAGTFPDLVVFFRVKMISGDLLKACI